MVGQERLERSTGTLSGCYSDQIELLAVVETKGVEPLSAGCKPAAFPVKLHPQVGHQPARVAGRVPSLRRAEAESNGGRFPLSGSVLPLNYPPVWTKRHSEYRTALVDLAGPAPATSWMWTRRSTH